MEAHALYVLRKQEFGRAELIFTSAEGVTYPILDTASVQNIVGNAINGTSSITIMQTIAERDEYVFAGDSAVYVVDATGDPEVLTGSALDGKVNTIDFNTLSQTMAGKANTQHTHELSEINGLVDRFDSITTGLNTLGNRITVTEGYIVQLNTRINDIVVPTSFDISAVNGLTAVIQDHSSRIDSKADSAHSHTANNITGLTTFVNTVLGTKTYASVGTSDW